MADIVIRCASDEFELRDREGRTGRGFTNLKRILGRPADFAFVVDQLARTARTPSNLAARNNRSGPSHSGTVPFEDDTGGKARRKRYVTPWRTRTSNHTPKWMTDLRLGHVTLLSGAATEVKALSPRQIADLEKFEQRLPRPKPGLRVSDQGT